MKILHSADWHLDAPLQGYEELKDKLLSVPSLVADLCQREGCELVLLAGDLFDGDTYTQKSFRALYNALERMSVPVFITPGNHDHITPNSPWLRESFPENVHIFKHPRIEKAELPGVTVYGAGYTSMDCPALLDGFTATGDGLRLGILHGEFLSRSPYCPITHKQVEASRLHYLALGHIHGGGVFNDGSTLCAFSGCPMGTDFGQCGEKGVLIIDTDDLRAPRFVGLGLPAFFDLTAPVETTAENAVAAVLPPVGDGNYYRITLTGRSAPVDMPALTARFAAFPHLILRDETLPPPDIWKDLGESSFAGEYFSLLKEALDAADTENADILTLAASISRQILDGEEVVLP